MMFQPSGFYCKGVRSFRQKTEASNPKTHEPQTLKPPQNHEPLGPTLRGTLGFRGFGGLGILTLQLL